MIDKRIFVDTNILVYAHDTDAGEKHGVAEKKIAALWQSPLIPVISVQVLQEFYVNLIRRNVSNQDSRSAVQDYLAWNVVDNDCSLMKLGIEVRERWQLSLWDALIVAAAQRGGARLLWTEDLNPGQDYGGPVATNPLVL